MNRLLLSNSADKCVAAIVCQDRLMDYAEHSNLPTGSIYKARVIRRLPEINALFADIGTGQQVFVNCDDLSSDDPITDGSWLLLQITRPATANKAAIASGKIKISGEYLVYLPQATVSGISKKIRDSVERQRLVAFLRLYPDEKFVVRTAATAATLEQLQEEAAKLIKRWRQLSNRHAVEPKPRLLFSELDFMLRYVRDNIVRYALAEIVIDDKTVEPQICEFIAQSGNNCQLIVAGQGGDIFARYNFTGQIAQLGCRELILENGVRITIDCCEALTAIDVNSGGYVSHNSSNTAIVEINCSAAAEIARQIRLRNLAGIICIDFLKTDNHGRDAVLKTLRDYTAEDISKIELLGFTRAGLFEIVRKSLSFDILVDRSNS